MISLLKWCVINYSLKANKQKKLIAKAQEHTEKVKILKCS